MRDETDEIKKKKKGTGSTGRSYQPGWSVKYPWISTPPEKNGNIICKICSEAYEKKLPCAQREDSRTMHAISAFVTDGFSSWRNALQSFNNHEKSQLHTDSAKGLSTLQNDSVIQHISYGKKKQMIEARIALQKMYECIELIAERAYPIRSHSDKNNILDRLLKMRSKDVPEIKSWLNKDSGYKWLHHNTTEEIMKMMTDRILNKLISEVKTAKYYSIIIDETSDCACLEQVSICVRFVDEDFTIREEFLGFYETQSTTSETLLKIVKDILIRFQLNLNAIRGQCFDGAANVRGYKSGLQSRLIEEEPRALFVHCAAHRLNLVVQDNVQQVQIVRDFIGVVQNLINFVKDSPKRIAFFKDLQHQNASTNNPTPITLQKYCPTRWCLRVKSLRTILANYKSLMDFFEGIVLDKTSESKATATVSGFLQKMESFSFYFCLKVLIVIFEKIETLNKQFQNNQLHVVQCHDQVELVLTSLVEQRANSFPEVWNEIVKGASDMNLTEPALPRVRRVPKKIDDGSEVHKFSSAEDYYRKQFFEIIDNTISSLKERFDKATTSFFDKIENFLIKNADDDETDVKNCNEIVEFYKDDLDAGRLLVHRNMLLDLMGKKPSKAGDVIEFLKKDSNSCKLLSQVTLLCKLLLTVPATTCTAERSFSTLRRIKTYLRSTLHPDRLNHAAILHIHQDYLDQIDSDELLNEWISRNQVRAATFHIGKIL